MTIRRSISGSGSINIQMQQTDLFSMETLQRIREPQMLQMQFFREMAQEIPSGPCWTVSIDANSALELNPGTSGTITTLINSWHNKKYLFTRYYFQQY